MTSPASFQYAGSELDLFSRATNWKSYYARLIRPYFGKKVLEVGAGIGATTRFLCDGSQERWVCLEPDRRMASTIERSIQSAELPDCCEAFTATAAQMEGSGTFDSVLYVDVLEHIERDLEEVGEAVRLLKPGGRLIVLSPAHQGLYSPFDRAIGHWRRYDRQSLGALIPSAMKCEKLIYLDSAGLLVSWLNARMLHRNMPNRGQIFIWDKLIVPVSRVLDPVLGYRFGKSILGVWTK